MKETFSLSCWFVISSDSAAASNLKTSVPHHFTFIHPLLPVLHLCYSTLLIISHLATIFQSPPPQLYLKSLLSPSQWPSVSICSSFTASFTPVFPAFLSTFSFFSVIFPFYSVSPSPNLSCLIFLFHSWLNTFSLPYSIFLSPPNLSSFISIFHSFTVGYIFLPFSFNSAFFSNLSILISIFLLFSVETCGLTRETTPESNKQRWYRTRWLMSANKHPLSI